MARSQVPKFGNWESEEDVPYTVYFDNARKKGKTGGKMNPNDPQDYADTELKGQKGQEVTRPEHRRRPSREDDDLRSSMDSPLHSDATSQKSNESHHRRGGTRYGNLKSVESEGPRGPETIRVRHERQRSREDGDLRRPTDSPLRTEAAHRRPAHDSPLHRHGGLSAGETPKRSSRQGAGSDRSIDNSPLHPQFQAKTARGTGVSSPSWDRKSSLEGGQGMAPLTPGRSRLRSVTRGDDTPEPDNSAAVPKFGDWDETDPSSAEGYTHIFNKVREEKQSGAGKVPSMSDTDANGHKRIGRDNSKGWGCFPCIRR